MAAIANFVHLRVHSAFSLLEGALQPDEIAELCKTHRMPAVAITDTNNLFGLMDLTEALVKAGVQPIVGCQFEIPLEAEKRAGAVIAKGMSGTLAVLVQNERGYANLMKLASKAHLDGMPGDTPHISWVALEDLNEGLIVLTGGRRGLVNRLIGDGQLDAAMAALRRLKSIFADRLYIELQRHGLADEAVAEPHLVRAAYELEVPLVASNEPFFSKCQMHVAHDALLCIAGGAYVSQDERRRESPDHYFKSAEEMTGLFSDVPEAIASTIEIAKRCAFYPTKRSPILPPFKPASGLSPEEELRTQARAGLKVRLEASGLFAVEKDYWERLEFELDVIIRMNFAGYFLIVSDFMKWTRGQGIPVGVRGSGAGSVVAWGLQITALDPLRFGLVFERFLNPERVSMPDFDIDFCQDRRGEVIRYVQDKYGKDRVAQIITFGTLQARAALRDVGRVLQMPQGQVDRIAKMIKVKPGSPSKLRDAINEEPRLQQMENEEEAVKRLFSIAGQLEGLYRHASTHAAGVVIGDRPLDEIVPLYRDPSSDMPVTQFDYEGDEKAGLVKFDFLGLKTLTVIAGTEALVAERHGIRVKAEEVPFDDKKSFEALSKGASTGIFQLESTGMRDLLRKMRPDRVEDLIALVALYRPGPMDNIPKYIACKHGREKPFYLHPALEPILSDTYGVMTYQEDVMLIARELAGYSMGQADELRRAMGKKIKEQMAAHRAKFIEGAALKKNIPAGIAEQIFDQAEKFAGYGFNKAHAAAYAQVAYQTAWLKANYPVEFFCASMTLDISSPERLSIFRQEAERLGIVVAPPDINVSGALFSAGRRADGSDVIYYALAAVRNVGRAAMDHVVEVRAAGGRFTSVFDFARRVDAKYVNRRILENLVAAGAFDSLTSSRAQVHAAIEMMLGEASMASRERESSQVNLFGEVEKQADRALPSVEQWTMPDRLAREFGAIGFYMSAHPLDEFNQTLQRLRCVPYAELAAEKRREDRAVTLAGSVIRRADRRTRDDKRMSHIGFSDASGMFEAVVFAEVLAQGGQYLEPGRAVVLDVATRWDGDDLKLQILRVQSLDEAASQTGAGLRIYIDNPKPLASIAERVKGQKGKGLISLVFPVENGEREVELELPGRYAVTPGLRGALRVVNGVQEVEEV
ncbi:MAG: DNA polymerase III subunit alpha [Alphaproteobacteria bacterium]|nr:DNA polymerase III subunit alpha [Alphaproteobacteria bacterium]